jgi:hypothetical protein
MKLDDAIKIVRKQIMKNYDLTSTEIEALSSLTIHAMESKEKEIETWACECDCYAVYKSTCLGEHGINKYSKRTCPFYSPEDK